MTSGANAEPITRLILELGRLPGVGGRTAARLAYYIIKASCPKCQQRGPSLANDLAQALLDVEAQVGLCRMCHNLCAGDLCRVCEDPRRDPSLICVVEGVADLRAIESSGHRGLYHVLHGALAPLDGVGPDDLKLKSLLPRLRGVQEVILATNANVEGDATALYVAHLLRPLDVRVTRLAAGIPLGGELEYLDQGTLGRALAERRDF